MSELQNSICKMNIRGELNLLYAVSKMIVTILDMAETNEVANDTLRSAADSLLDQAARLYNEIDTYTTELHGTQ